ncbi:diguanylate cyclase [uncultured Enterovirga sp.]|uniref:sensor domain-containing diguanylate cyclase n=1 Tax=uncultured Enterovirga sp. TaxID=2026352 RepID=UPI0035CA1547
MRQTITRAGRNLSLRWRLLILLGLVAAVLVADGGREILSKRADLIAGARERLQNLARTGADRQEGIVADARAVLTLAVEMSEAGPQSGSACRKPFARAVDAIPWLEALAVFRPDGSALCGSRDVASTVNVADRAYFQSAIATRSFALSGYVTTRTDQRPSLVAAMPRIVDGEIESVAMARIDLDWLNAMAARVGEASRTTVILTDAGGTVISAYPDHHDWAGRNVSALGFPISDPTERETILDVVGLDGPARIFAAVTLPQTGGRVFVGAERDVVLAPAHRQTLVSAVKLVLGVLVCAGVLWFGTERLVVKPAEALAAVSTRFGDGDLAARVDETKAPLEFARLARSFNTMASRLAQRDAELRAVNEQLAELATVDALTGLANRRLFDERLAQEWRRAARSGRPVGAVIVDIDHFKAFNDTYGHPEGDSCLRRVARVIGSGLRTGDLAARVGGEEFALLLPGADIHRTLHVARLLRLGIESVAVPHAGNPAGIVTVSAGAVSLLPARGGPSEDILRLADEALYRAKRAGRNRVAGPADPATVPSRVTS